MSRHRELAEAERDGRHRLGAAFVHGIGPGEGVPRGRPLRSVLAGSVLAALMLLSAYAVRVLDGDDRCDADPGSTRTPDPGPCQTR
ncbi:hypothetical protein [Nocardioides sp.]|uniref:hypothetical protein n=1 Tax=Nocardioides sp. TaxID=35761 RepID=UPI003D0EA768